jgi:penicillin G amidase
MALADPPVQPSAVRSTRSKPLRALAVVLLTLAVLAVAALLWLRSRLYASLPQESGERMVSGLAAAVVIERDGLGMPAVHAANRLDAAVALGFLHGQERFFQMDLLRRLAAGELADLVGAAAVPLDRDHRLHRCRAVAAASLRQAAPAERALVEAYSRGVNAGLAALGAAPPEYLALRATPAPWQPADSYLAVLGMFFNLNDSHASEEAVLATLQGRLPRPLFDFIAPVGTEWDAPLLGEAFATPPVPGPEVVDLRRPAGGRSALGGTPGRPPGADTVAAKDAGAPPVLAAFEPGEPRGKLNGAADGGREGVIAGLAGMGVATAAAGDPDDAFGHPNDAFGHPDDAFGHPDDAFGHPDDAFGVGGSNNWAVSGAHTADGHALIANDMHLGLSLPNTWYRAALRWHDGAGRERQVTGVTLPGTPGVAVGSNGHVAWAFTNSYGDFADLIDLEPVAGDPDSYRAPGGPRHFAHLHERIHVRRQADQDLEVLETIWGPVLPGAQGAPRRALAWTAHFPDAVNLAAFALEGAQNLDEAVEAAHRAGIPPQNFTVADDTGRIGWTIIGKIPRRIGFDGRTPTSWSDGTRRWDGWLDSGEVPALLDPPAGRVWTANARVVDGQMLARLGNAGYDLGARAKQIRDDLLHLERATPRDLLAIQLDDRALFLERWRRLLLDTLSPAAVRQVPRRGELRRVVATTWTGHASTDSAAYRIVREFRGRLEDRIFWSLVGIAPAGAGQPGALHPSKQFEGPLWRLVQERPPHLLEPRYKTWEDELLAAADAVLAGNARIPAGSPRGDEAAAGGLANRTWGERNTVTLRHPLSRAIPFLARWLDLPPRQLPGDRDMPRVQGVTFGASERLVVSPGHEDQGIFEMPGGESGHPLSRHYGDGEGAWERGEPTPFLPGPAVVTLRLVPGKT